jgi:hypothetical protein
LSQGFSYNNIFLSCLSVTKKIIISIGNERFSNLYFYFLKSTIPRNINQETIHLSFLPKGGGAAEAFQSLFSHTDWKIRDGYGEDGCGRKVVGTGEVDTDPAFALSVI